MLGPMFTLVPHVALPHQEIRRSDHPSMGNSDDDPRGYHKLFWFDGWTLLCESVSILSLAFYL